MRFDHALEKRNINACYYYYYYVYYVRQFILLFVQSVLIQRE